MFRILILIIFMSFVLLVLNGCSKKNYDFNPWTTVIEILIKENKNGMDNKWNSIGLTLMAIGFVGFLISICMESHYERKLFELNEKLNKDKDWRKKHYE